jgi:hypothetical protein
MANLSCPLVRHRAACFYNFAASGKQPKALDRDMAGIILTAKIGQVKGFLGSRKRRMVHP